MKKKPCMEFSNKADSCRSLMGTAPIWDSVDTNGIVFDDVSSPQCMLS